MSAHETYSFNGYTARPAQEKDLTLATMWTLADPEHRDRLAPAFWLQQGAGIDSYLMLDGDGPVFFFTLRLTRENHVRIFIQFPCALDEMHEKTEAARSAVRRRISSGLFVGLRWLEEELAPTGVKEIFFDSRSETLIRFCVKSLGFKQNGEWLRKRIKLPQTAAAVL